MHDTASRAIEYRFSSAPIERTCPVCNNRFASRIGMWPFIAGSSDAVCGSAQCAAGEDVTGPPSCDVYFEFTDLGSATISAIRDAAVRAPVAEAFRTASMRDDVPEHDRNLMQLAAIDLQYCQADDTTIEEFEPRLVLRTCGEAAGEMLLSGCGDII